MSNRRLRLVSLLGVLALAAAACTTGAPSGQEGTTTTTLRERLGRSTSGSLVPAVFGRNALVTYDACEPFLDYVTSHAVEMVGPYGLQEPFYPWVGRGGFFVEEDAALAAVAEDDGGSTFSGTNVQVLGVDEPDIVKTDGERIIVLAEGTLIIADVTADEPFVESRLPLEGLSVHSLFLSGDTVLLFGSSWGNPVPLIESDAEFAPIPQAPMLQIVEVDIRGEAEIVRTMSLDGQFISARMVGDSVRVVLTSGPVGFEWSYPSGSGLRAERKAVEENREIVLESTEENWIPYYIISDEDGDVTDEGILFDCDRASHPEEFSGLSMLSVLTIDVSEGLEVVDSTGILATGSTVYASLESLYVATQNWQTRQWLGSGAEDDRVEMVTTDIHKFDTSSAWRTEYRGSGRVDGYLLNQFAMDEHDGLLRVASTSQPAWWGGGFESESMITVLAEDDGELVEIGFVDGLGETEQIYSVRFMGDVAYVVTFRQTDPLYTVDLSDPTDPEVTGELKILGYSAYLHPLGDGLLLGVGQDATETGRIKGTQVSVFDVSDPSDDPRLLDQYTLSEGSSSEVEYNHHAFLYWDETGLAMIPVQQWWWDGKTDSSFLGAVGLEIDDDGDIREVRRIAHPGGERDGWDWRAQIQRSIVIEDSVFTVSNKGIMKSDLDDLREQAWLGF